MAKKIKTAPIEKKEEPETFPISNREIVKAYIARHLWTIHPNILVINALAGKTLKGNRLQRVSDMIFDQSKKLRERLMVQCERRGHANLHKTPINTSTASPTNDTSH